MSLVTRLPAFSALLSPLALSPSSCSISLATFLPARSALVSSLSVDSSSTGVLFLAIALITLAAFLAAGARRSKNSRLPASTFSSSSSNSSGFNVLAICFKCFNTAGSMPWPRATIAIKPFQASTLALGSFLPVLTTDGSPCIPPRQPSPILIPSWPVACSAPRSCDEIM